MAFDPLKFLVRDLIPAEGVTLICSKPKVGKSWLLLDHDIAAAAGLKAANVRYLLKELLNDGAVEKVGYGKAPNNLLQRDWIAQARAVRIEDEIARRGIKLSGRGPERCGPCPKCGGTDRFAINTSKQIWNCRGCQRGGDVISLVQHLDGCAFDAAVATLSRQDSTRCGNGKNAAGHDVEIEQRKPKQESI